MDMAYTKLHQSLVTSTIWREPHTTRIVWITMMALADQHGEVMASIPGLADSARVSIKECEDALAAFLAPDPYSRTKDFEGRRIENIDGGWSLLNHPKYRKMASKEDSKEKASARTARYRARVKAGLVDSCLSTPCDGVSTQGRDIAEAEAEAEESKNTPLAPQGGNASPSSKGRRKAGQFERVKENTPTMSLIGGWFGRKATNLWTVEDAAKLKAIDPDPDDIAVMDQWFTKTREQVVAVSGFDARQTALATLLNNWSTAADRARAFKADSR